MTSHILKPCKRTYVLPTDTLERFEKAVEPGMRSRTVAAIIASWVQEREREQLRREVIEGRRAMWDVYRDAAGEWAPLDAEIDRGVI